MRRTFVRYAPGCWMEKGESGTRKASTDCGLQGHVAVPFLAEGCCVSGSAFCVRLVPSTVRTFTTVARCRRVEQPQHHLSASRSCPVSCRIQRSIKLILFSMKNQPILYCHIALCILSSVQSFSWQSLLVERLQGSVRADTLLLYSTDPSRGGE